MKIVNSHLIKKYLKYMIFAFMSEKLPLENHNTPINFITVQNVIEAFDDRFGEFIIFYI